RGGNSQDEENKHLTVKDVKEAGKGDEIHIDCQQHQLDAHQQNQYVLPVQEYPGQGNAEQHRAQGNETRQCQHQASSPSLFILTMRSRSSRLTRIWRPTSWYFVPGRRR